MSNELMVLENINAVEVFKAGGIDPIIKAIREEVAHDVPDVSTVKGRKEVASRAYKVRQSKSYLDKAGKELADKLNAQLKPINAERKKAREELDKLASEVRAPLDEWEANEEARKDAHKNAIKDIVNSSLAECVEGYAKNVAQLKVELSFIESVELGDHWEEFSEQAAMAKDAALKLVKSNIELRQKYEDEQAELERLRQEAVEREQKERDERIAREAEERIRREAEEAARKEAELVKAEAERVERERIEAIRQKEEAERRVIYEKEQAELRAKEQAERAEREKQEAIDREQRLAEEREAARIRNEQKVKAEAEEAERARKANQEHRRKINQEILSCLVGAGISEDHAKEVIKLAVTGSAGRLTIDY